MPRSKKHARSGWSTRRTSNSSRSSTWRSIRSNASRTARGRFRGGGMEGVRFGIFDFSPSTGELWRDGVPVRLQAQPARLLAALVARAGQVVTRETLQREIWGDGTHVDFERGLNFCIAQVRGALGDSADSPRFIETVPKQGYRFVAPVRWIGSESDRAEMPVEPQ